VERVQGLEVPWWIRDNGDIPHPYLTTALQTLIAS